MDIFGYIGKSALNRLVSNIKSKLARISFTGKLSDSVNDVSFRPIIEISSADYAAIPESEKKDKLYLVSGGEEERPVGIVEINEAINGKVLWENPNPGVEFAAQSVGISGMDSYDYLEIVCKLIRTHTNTFTTGKLPVVENGRLAVLNYAGDFNYIRIVNAGVDEIVFNDALYYKTYGTNTSSTVRNNILIPYRILGYKKATFDPFAGVLPSAADVKYDNSASGIEAGNVQDAIDEVCAWEDITAECVFAIQPYMVSPYNSFIKYNKATGQIIGALNYNWVEIDNQALLFTLPDRIKSLSKFIGQCGMAYTNKEQLALYPRVYQGAIYSSHTVAASTGSMTVYQLNFIL